VFVSEIVVLVLKDIADLSGKDYDFVLLGGDESVDDFSCDI